jgi:hypothetical protein
MDFFILARCRRAMLPRVYKSRVSNGVRAIVFAAGVSLTLAGCSSDLMLGDKLPASAGGLPDDAPARPQAATYQYPAVHDMPPARAVAPLSDVEQARVENDLQAARDRLEVQSGPALKPPAAQKTPAKRQPPDAQTGEASGVTAKP